MAVASNRWGAAARFGVPGLMLGALATLALGGDRAPAARAQVAPPAGTDGTIAFTANAPGGLPLLYLVDTRARAFAIYRVDRGTVQLQAARQYGWDLKLTEFNNQAPDVAAVEAMVSTARAGAAPPSRP